MTTTTQAKIAESPAQAVLRKLEWSRRLLGFADRICPSCGWAEQDGHAPSCELAAALRDPEQADSRSVPAELRALLERVPKGPLKWEVSEVGDGPDRRPIAFVMSDDDQYLLVDEDPPCIEEPPAPYAQAAVECINFVRSLLSPTSPGQGTTPEAPDAE